MIIVTAAVEVPPDQLEHALAISLVHVRRSREEPGCVSHGVHQDVEKPNRLLFFEEWADRAALDAHFAVPEARAFSRELGRLAASPTELKVYEADRLTL
jgi:quinol monooxygenase YgiN